MDYDTIKKNLARLATRATGLEVTGFAALPPSGSARRYYRLQMADNSTLIGTYAENRYENQTFIYLAKHFEAMGLNVPKILAVATNGRFYIQSDLGSTTLFDIIASPDKFPNCSVEKLVEQCLTQLVRFQVDGANNLDHSMLRPAQCFNRRTVMWDLNYFKYNFLKLNALTIDERTLEDEFDALADYLLLDDLTFFQYRDFQSRNVMMLDNELYFIDFQGGRLGPCLYDVASFLYQAQANFSEEFRAQMFDFYLNALAQRTTVRADELRQRFPVIVAFRILQTLGAYGFRGLFEGKPHFIKSIPTALHNLLEIKSPLFENLMPYTLKLVQFVANEYVTKKTDIQSPDLTVHIFSLSLKKGYPPLDPLHGGGFVFDCRSLPNPGRVPGLMEQCGRDAAVIDFLDRSAKVNIFMRNAEALVLQAITNFRTRNFNFLSVAFGCSGGRHRSVYCANRLANSLAKIQGVKVEVVHNELGPND